MTVRKKSSARNAGKSHRNSHLINLLYTTVASSTFYSGPPPQSRYVWEYVKSMAVYKLSYCDPGTGKAQVTKTVRRPKSITVTLGDTKVCDLLKFEFNFISKLALQARMNIFQNVLLLSEVEGSTQEIIT